MMMRTFFLFFIIISTIEFAEAQYIIPGASQQPAWVFPIWIEDSLGRKDTVYIGYDNSASFFSCYDDTFYNEKHIYFDWNDTTKLDAFLCDHSFGGGIDSIKKIDVRNSLGNFSLWVHACYYPIILRWDVSLFYSDSLPYPDQDPLPRAQGEIIWDYFPNEVEGCFDPFYPILISDTCNNYYCCKRDSAIINGDGLNGSLGTSFFTLKIKAWTGDIPLSITKVDNPEIDLYPNPVRKGSLVQLKSVYNFFIASLFNVYGTLIKKITVSNNTILLPDIKEGVYFLTFKNKSQILTIKLIVY